MSNDFPEITDEPWARKWLLLEDWLNDPGWENGFVGITGSSPSSLALLNERFGSGRGPRPLSLEQVFEAQSQSRALVLLGRPDAGKSHELRRFQRDLPKSVLIQAKDIAEPLPQHLDRVAGDGQEIETIVFDSLDESLIADHRNLGSLSLWLRLRDTRLGFRSTRLVLSCRWADWPESRLKAELQQWTGEAPATYVLLPLSEEDARATATRVLKGKAEPFWTELRDRKLGWLACWPRAFISMMRTWCLEGALPDSPRHLIDRFVSESLQVTEDFDDGARKSRNPKDGLWIERIAGRAAAAMFFCGRSAFSLSGSSDPGVLSIAQLRGEEKWLPTIRSVTDDDLRELQSRTCLLRRLADSQHLVFHSQVVQETLAARWLAAQKLPLKRLIPLFSKTNWVFPQLRAMAAAFAEKEPDFRKWLLEHDPVVLLLADHTSLTNEQKREMVDALLDYTRSIETIDTSVWQGHLGTLKHPDLLAQLQSRLLEKDAHPAVAQVAIEIAAKAKPAGIAEMLWEALPMWKGGLKSQLALAIVNTAPESTSPAWQDRWRSVIDQDVPTDPDGVLIGHALKVMVPGHLPIRDAVEWVVHDSRFAVIGLFSFFLWTAGKHVTADDVPTVLDYMAREQIFYLDHIEHEGPFGQEQGVAVTTIKLAFRHLELPAVRKSLEAYWVALMTHTNFGCQISLPDLKNWIEKFSLIEADRRNFALSFLSGHQFTFSNSMYDGFGCFLLDPGTDGPWLLDQIPEAGNALAINLAQVSRGLFSWGDFRRQHPDRLLKVWRASLYLQKILPADSGEDGPFPRLERQEEMFNRARAAQEAEREAKISENRRCRELERSGQLADIKEDCKEAHLNGALVWPQVYQFLLFTHCGPAGGLVSHRYAIQPASSEAWISDAARRHLRDWPAEAVNRDNGMMAQFALTWLGPDALKDPAILQRLEAVWLPWLIQWVSDDSHPAWMPKGMEWLDRFPATELAVFRKIILNSYPAKDDMTFLSGWSARWTEKHTAILVDSLLENPIQPEGAGPAWLFLAEKDFPAAREVIEFWLKQCALPPAGSSGQTLEQNEVNSPQSESLPAISPVNTVAKELVLGLAFAGCRGLFWENLSKSLLGNDELVEKCLHALHNTWSRWAFHSSKGKLPVWVQLEKWASDPLVAFAEILWRIAPRTDRTSQGAYFVSWKDDTIELRHAAVAEAQSRGLMVSPAAGDQDWVPSLRHEADVHRLAREWQAFTPSDFFEWAIQPEARLARDNGQFLECVLESLDAWESKLQRLEGQAYLKDPGTGKFFDEPIISKGLKDWLKEHLRIIGSAESQPFQCSDERFDVLLEWPSLQGREILSLIIEVKKNTYRPGRGKNLLSEMENQLLRGYLEPQHRLNKAITHGLYLVVWVKGKRSDDKESAKIDRHRNQLEKQALKLSKPPLVIRSRVIDARPV